MTRWFAFSIGILTALALYEPRDATTPLLPPDARAVIVDLG